MSGDTIRMLVQSYYNSGAGGTNNSSFTDVLNSLAGGLVNATGGAHGTLSNLTTSGSSVYTGLTSFLNSNDSTPASYPKAYLNWIFLDDQFNYVSSLSGAVLATSSTYPAGQLNTVAPGSQLPITRNGYLFVWVSNETQGWDVFFDNLFVQHKQGPLLEENHYYPFGLTMAGVSDKAIKTQYAENKFRFNDGTELQNKEFSDGAGLELYETGFRSYDQQLGIFRQQDPLTDQFSDFSPYSYCLNNPVLFNDPLGLKRKLPEVGVPGGQLPYMNVQYSLDPTDWANMGGPGGDLNQALEDQEIAGITPHIAQSSPEVFLPTGTSFQSYAQTTDNMDNSVLRIYYNYGVQTGPGTTDIYEVASVKTVYLGGRSSETEENLPGQKYELHYQAFYTESEGMIDDVYGGTVSPRPATLITKLPGGLVRTVNVTAVDVHYRILTPLPAPRVTIAWSCIVTVITATSRNGQFIGSTSYSYEAVDRKTFSAEP